MGKRNKHKRKFRVQPGSSLGTTPAAGQTVPGDADGIDADAAGEGEGLDAAPGTELADELPPVTEGDGRTDAAASAGWAFAPAAGAHRSPFLILADYEQRSLAHVAGLPEQLDAPGLWRGVAYRIGRHRLASGFDEVAEILPMPLLTPVPGALPWLLGVANIRGTLLPVVDLKQFLEGDRTVLHERQRVLVVRQPGGDVAVTIDELYGQRSFIEEQGIEAAAVAAGRYAHFIDRAYRVDGQDWGVFRLDRLARTPEFRQAAA